jgi:ribosome-binding protein aMBF1 (putative translation factor)
MEIKKTNKGWEYDGILFKDKRSALLTKKASEGVKSAKKKSTSKDAKLLYDGTRNLSFGKFIEEVLKAQDKSIVQLAADIGVSKQTLFSWMNGDSIPTLRHLETILDVTQCPVRKIRAALHDNFKMQEIRLFENLQKRA